ncbi:ABC transporter permease [Neorhizobium galegae]|uniref:ABC di/oligopeptide transporter n=2 Tax=Neorhizobium galegae TaxID=399 RepID=A0A068SPB2_NEOGA|nr:ABC transporter permease [Neorhizobium galegae]KAB1086901.1 ABC transporter permease [Neorhizobium galegae]MCQ1853796.1 ABC transporter permease [Neorhizobium galegae]CDN48147.1 ABC di/oligopeptide transporter [Neorhizobium galegae bv. orientalis str. HAMBI 540]CDZ46514.1 Putative oligopeptide ABC transporter, permease protein AppB [Neorhizobium galegae bv. orientalis]
MLNFLLKKLPSVVVVAIASSLIAFILPRMAPGDPAVALAGSDASPEQLAAVREQIGLNGPLHEQYFHWMWNLLHGDLGRSFAMRRPVSALIMSRLESTVELAALALMLMIIIGFTLGILSATLRHQSARAGLDILNTICLATPPFLTGLLLILLLGIAFPILPVSGEIGLLRDPLKGLQFLILPAFALALPQAAVVARLLTTAINSVRGEDFIDLAKAKGVPPGRLMRRHLLRNSLGPAIVAIGLRAGELLGGAIVIEAIFARNGLGQLAVSSVQNRDYLVLQALILGAVLIAVLIQLLSEIAIAALDPRIRLES